MIGVPIGLAVGNFRLARKLIEPWTEFLRFIPATAMITVAVIWFGIGEELEDLPDRLQHDIHRDTEYRGRGGRDCPEQNPGSAGAWGQ